MPVSNEIPNAMDKMDELIAGLLAQPTPQAQSSFLHAHQRLNPSGLSEVLDWAAQLMGSDPGKARQLALVCEAVASEANAHVLIPRATYLRAQTHAMDADFAAALNLIEIARAGFAALGQDYEAARTHVGRMFVLQELGRYAEALQAGQAVRAYLESAPQTDEAQDERDALAARVLQNLGLCYELMGQYDPALAAYSDAEARFGLLDMNESLADVSNNRGIVLLSLGRGHDALEAFERAYANFAAAKLTLKQTHRAVGTKNPKAHHRAARLAASVAVSCLVRRRAVFGRALRHLVCA
jgi:tetratricopeptide (TPR) repeat protein